MKPELKAPGTNLFTPQHDKPLSNFAFNFNLRRYNLRAPRRPPVSPNHPGAVGVSLRQPGVVHPELRHHVRGRGLHSSSFRLNVCAFCGIGGSFVDCLRGVLEVFWG